MTNILSFSSGNRGKCYYLDYYVDGVRLSDTLKVGDFIPPFGWLKPETEQKFASMLLRKTESDLRPGRIPLFVCPECVDYGCGAVTCEIARNDQQIIWTKFGFENNYDETLHRSKECEFRFDATQYWQTFQDVLQRKYTEQSAPRKD
jgi:hypothetical protein